MNYEILALKYLALDIDSGSDTSVVSRSYIYKHFMFILSLELVLILTYFLIQL